VRADLSWARPLGDLGCRSILHSYLFRFLGLLRVSVSAEAAVLLAAFELLGLRSTPDARLATRFEVVSSLFGMTLSLN
jgi:hypothetical protein